MAQFRVEFVLDQASGKYLAELYNPEDPKDLMLRTEALYPTPAAAMLGVVQLFQHAMPKKKPAAKAQKRKNAAKSRRRRNPR